ncbi:MAG: tetratricopeptide repeat protein [Chitinophagales bacterium]
MIELPDFNKLWNYSNPQETEAKFRELIPQAEAAKNEAYEAELLTQIARTQGLQRKFEAAHLTLDGIEAWLQNHGEEHRVKIRYLLERGRVFNSSNQPEKAIPLFTEAWQLAESVAEDYYAVDALHMIAFAEIARPDEKLKWEEKAMALAEKSQDKRTKLWLGSLYNNMGWSYHDKKAYEKALSLFEKALEWQQEYGNERSVGIAKWCIARAYRSLGRVEDALQLQQKALAKSKGVDSSGYIWEEIAECYWTLQQKEKAKPYFKLAYDKLSQDPWMMANEKARMERMKELAEKLI